MPLSLLHYFGAVLHYFGSKRNPFWYIIWYMERTPHIKGS
ncbi:hypothetical protein PALB_10850 [Pseudoalteromonas luteoviolacea B = ATCC 29581]|nr:hypothetical protein PALB_10850 [Pseudoalteromonas luteoviolacea B = ATCC 29581]